MPTVDLKPSDSFDQHTGQGEVLLLACGALAREIVDLVDTNKWKLFDIQCLPAKWHNTPQFIVPALRDKIMTNKARYKRIYVVYGDCGTGGQLDTLLQEEGVERIDGPHCYAFYSGNKVFAEREAEEFTCFFLTDYLARHFEKLMWEGLGLDRHPELLQDYFGNYTKLIYLAQTEDAGLQARAEAAAKKLGLDYEYRFTGYGELKTEMARLAK